jgi:hypothetical protein
VFCVMGGLYYLMEDSVGFDNLMHGKSPKKNQKQRSLEDFGRFPLCSAEDIMCAANLFHSCFTTTSLHPTREELVRKSCCEAMTIMQKMKSIWLALGVCWRWKFLKDRAR